ncbi:uncharacterized protein LOC130934397 [Arachis stenosperma]|uniref:uncharacterized protein LOC130934397 n=1 Tax=Arachis stenosperma TaxID=217475 RepID=UPI0025AB7BEC|nr:uncharacterized protein LOC130934397 [Arachis stenosperma]
MYLFQNHFFTASKSQILFIPALLVSIFISFSKTALSPYGLQRAFTHSHCTPTWATIDLPGHSPANLRTCNSDYRALTCSPALSCGRCGPDDLPGRTLANLRPRNSGDHHPRGSRSQIMACVYNHDADIN